MLSIEELLVREQELEKKRKELIAALKEDLRGRLGERFDAQLDPRAEAPFHGLMTDELDADLVVLIASLMSELTNAGLDRDLEVLKRQFEYHQMLKDGKSALGEQLTSIDLAPNTHMGLQIEEFPDNQTAPGEVYAWMSSNIPTIGNKTLDLGKDIAKPLAEAGIPLNSRLRKALWEVQDKRSNPG